MTFRFWRDLVPLAILAILAIGFELRSDISTEATTPEGAPISVTHQWPYGSTPITAIGTGSTGAVSATLAAAAGQYTYLCGIEVSAIGGTATVGPITITNLEGHTFTIQFASAASGAVYWREFNPCLQSTAVNTAIVAATTADATASAVDVNLHGFQQ
jgi:hypothetical protein